MNYKNAKTILIGGGNNQYVLEKNLNNKIDKEVLILDENKLQINPDIIPLLGHIKLRGR